jgi:hypothetical protein
MLDIASAMLTGDTGGVFDIGHGPSPRRHHRCMFDLLTLFHSLALQVQKAFFSLLSPVARSGLSFFWSRACSVLARVKSKDTAPARHTSSSVSALAVGALAATAEAQADMDALQHLML